MIKNTKHLFVFIIAIITFIGCNEDKITKSAYNLVNPFIGTGGHGHTYPGATLPFGMVQLSPDTRLDGWDGCGGYHYTDSIIYGFSHTHLSGTGVSDYGDILIMPFNSNESITYQQLQNHEITPSQFSKSLEKASPGYYEVEIKCAKVKLTSTKRVGIHHYTFKNKINNQILLDLNHRDKVLDFSIDINNRSVSGHRTSNAWATEQHMYFYMEFSEDFSSNPILKQDTLPDYYRILNFENTDSLVIKVGISATSIEGAKANLEAEANHWDFNKYKSDAKAVWEEALSKIVVNDKDEDKLTIFYSALYHTMIVPNVFSDVNGKYRGIDQKIHQNKKGVQYTVFSLWDTFRGAHPLYTIIEGEKPKHLLNLF